ncbi:hypothetical protein LIA77_01347 [Sarocladium implicatum]|nr:hypothetical protein LIA77_01347 [Sarocladium implicatum]
MASQKPLFDYKRITDLLQVYVGTKCSQIEAKIARATEAGNIELGPRVGITIEVGAVIKIKCFRAWCTSNRLSSERGQQLSRLGKVAVALQPSELASTMTWSDCMGVPGEMRSLSSTLP